MHPVISHQLFHAQPRFLHPRKKKNRSLLSPHILVSSTWICSILMYHTRVPNCAKKYEKYGHWKYPPFGFFPHTKSYVHLNSHLLRGLVAGCGLLNVHGFTLKRTSVHKSYVSLQKNCTCNGERVLGFEKGSTKGWHARKVSEYQIMKISPSDEASMGASPHRLAQIFSNGT